jgi:PAS domain S-box-containing protein
VNLIGSYDYALVALSVLIAMFASYAALALAARVTAASGWARAVWLLGGAGAMGTGIWSMHYIGMLAFILPVPVAYHWPTVLVSLFAAILASVIALYVVSRQRMSAFRAFAGSVLMGAGIASMHYIGMAAMRLPAMCRYDSFLVILSVVFAFLISLAALWITFHFRGEKARIGWRKIAGAVVMGAAIPVMHYTGMAAASFTPSGMPVDLSNAVSISTLGAAGIAAATLIVLGLALLTSWMDRRFAAQALELQEQKLQQSEAYLSEAQRLSHTGSFAWRVSTGEINWSEEHFRIFQYDRTMPPTVKLILQRVHPEDAVLVKQTVERAAQDGKDFDFEHRLLMPDGSVKYVHVVAHALSDESGSYEFVGSVMDITEQHQARVALEKAFDEIKKSQDRLQLVIDTIPAMVWSSLPDGSTDFVSQSWVEFYGLSLEDIGRVGWEVVIHPEDVARARDTGRAAMAAGKPFEYELRSRGADGEYRWFLSRAVPLRDETGNIVKWYGTMTDIEDRKRAEILLAGEKRLLEMIARGDSSALILDALCLLIEELAGGSLCSILLLDPNTNRLRHGAAPSLPANYTEAIDGNAIGPSEGSCGTAAYRAEQVIVSDIATDPLWADYRDLALAHGLRACWSTPILSSERRVLGTVAIYFREPRSPSPQEHNLMEQITDLASIAVERDQAEEVLREQARLLDLTHDTVFVRDMSDVITYWNRGAEELYGWTRQEALDKVSHRLTQTIFPVPLQEISAELRRTGRWEGELIHTKRDGTQVVVVSRWSLQRDEQGLPVAILETNNDITERKRAEAELRESLRRYRHIFQTVGVSIWEEDFSQVKKAIDELKATGVRDFGEYLAAHPELVQQAISIVKVIDVNDASVKLFAAHSKDELLVSLDKVFLPETQDVFARELIAIAEGRANFESETVLQTLAGDKLVVLFTITFPPPPATLDSVLVTITDVTERKRAEEALRNAQAELAHITRVTTLGEMTASIAHEINQPLAAVVTNGGACLRWLVGDSPNLDEAREAARRVIRDGNRASDVIARIRGLLRKTDIQKVPLDINDAIQEIVLLTQNEAARKGVRLQLELAADLSPVFGDRVQLQQVILNLVMNGVEAMDSVSDRARELVICSSQDESGQVLVAVQDCGVGIDRENPETIFNAFYTTKSQGMGMGLAISRSIVENHGGRLWAAANEGPGVTFQFTLQACSEQEQGIR